MPQDPCMARQWDWCGGVSASSLPLSTSSSPIVSSGARYTWRTLKATDEFAADAYQSADHPLICRNLCRHWSRRGQEQRSLCHARRMRSVSRFDTLVVSVDWRGQSVKKEIYFPMVTLDQQNLRERHSALWSSCPL